MAIDSDSDVESMGEASGTWGMVLATHQLLTLITFNNNKYNISIYQHSITIYNNC